MICHNPFCKKELTKVLTTTARYFCDEYCAFTRMKLNSEGKSAAEKWWQKRKEVVKKAFEKFPLIKEIKDDQGRVCRGRRKGAKRKGGKRAKKRIPPSNS